MRCLRWKVVSVIESYWKMAKLSFIPTDLHFPDEFAAASHRTKRNVFYDMIEDFTGDDDEEEDGSEEEEEDEASISESIESTTSRFGRFISPLAFSKFSETLGFIVSNLFLSPSFLSNGFQQYQMIQNVLNHSSCYSLIQFFIVELHLRSLRNLISPFNLIRLCRSPVSLWNCGMSTISCLFIGALNTVGRYIVNMTRGQEASITNNNPSENVPDAILTLTKNVLGQNVTNSIEPMIKRIGVVETRDDPALTSTTNSPSYEPLLNATVSTLQSIDAKKKKTKKQKTKRKDQPVSEQLTEQVEAFSQSRKIPILW